ncbi:hypothetical protein AAY473_031224 [Plecturocebus cupreus]
MPPKPPLQALKQLLGPGFASHSSTRGRTHRQASPLPAKQVCSLEVVSPEADITPRGRCGPGVDGVSGKKGGLTAQSRGQNPLMTYPAASPELRDRGSWKRQCGHRGQLALAWPKVSPILRDTHCGISVATRNLSHKEAKRLIQHHTTSGRAEAQIQVDLISESTGTDDSLAKSPLLIGKMLWCEAGHSQSGIRVKAQLIGDQGQSSECDQDQGSVCEQEQGSACDQSQDSVYDLGQDSTCDHDQGSVCGQAQDSVCGQDQSSVCGQDQGSVCDQDQGSACDQGQDSVCD